MITTSAQLTLAPTQLAASTHNSLVTIPTLALMYAKQPNTKFSLFLVEYHLFGVLFTYLFRIGVICQRDVNILTWFVTIQTRVRPTHVTQHSDANTHQSTVTQTTNVTTTAAIPMLVANTLAFLATILYLLNTQDLHNM